MIDGKLHRQHAFISVISSFGSASPVAQVLFRRTERCVDLGVDGETLLALDEAVMSRELGSRFSLLRFRFRCSF